VAMAVAPLEDDEVPFVETMTKRLSKRNFTALSAFRGAETLEKLKQRKNIDAVVQNVKMPGMDGIEYLTKPCDLEELVDKIRAACRR
jgi:DNA-binding response OmpR family regulator